MLRKKEKAIADATKGAEMRKRSMETFAATQEKLNNEQISETTPKRRNTGSETISYVSQRNEQKSEIRKGELAIRREEVENTRILLRQQSEILQFLFKVDKPRKMHSLTFYKNFLISRHVSKIFCFLFLCLVLGNRFHDKLAMYVLFSKSQVFIVGRFFG